MERLYDMFSILDYVLQFRCLDLIFSKGLESQQWEDLGFGKMEEGGI